MTRVLLILILILGVYCTITFPVFDLHGPACLCDVCLEAPYLDREEDTTK